MRNLSGPAVRYHGGKFRLAPWVISHFPPHRFYTEVFGGAAGVLLQKPRSYAEVYNDLDGDMTNFFRVLRDSATRQTLIEQCVLTPYSRAEFEQAWEPSADPVERARRLCVRAQMGFGSAGATKGTTGFRIDCFREYGTAQHLWVRFPENLRAVGERLTGVLIENRPAIEVLRAHDAPETLHYIDPPYLLETRVLKGGMKTGGAGYYRHEMTDAQHLELLEEVLQLRGMVVISGYPNEMYDQALDGWLRVSTGARISARHGTAIRTEVLWISPKAKVRVGGNYELFEPAV